VELIGEGKPVLDGEGRYQIITVKANRVRIEGFVIRNSGMSYSKDIAGIKVINSEACIIRENHFLNNFFALYLEKVKDCIVENNKIIGFAKSEGASGNGIHAWDSKNLYIKKNYIKGHRDGIYFEFVSRSTIDDNNKRQAFILKLSRQGKGLKPHENMALSYEVCLWKVFSFGAYGKSYMGASSRCRELGW